MSNFLPISVRPRETPCDQILSAMDTSSMDRFIMPILTAFPTSLILWRNEVWNLEGGKEKKGKVWGTESSDFLFIMRRNKASSFKPRRQRRSIPSRLHTTTTQNFEFPKRHPSNPLEITRYHSTTPSPPPGNGTGSGNTMRENDAIFLEQDEHEIMFFLSWEVANLGNYVSIRNKREFYPSQRHRV